jgi:hypothetical protein
MIPDYKKGKESAIRIFSLNQRKSEIDPEDTSGIVLVSPRLRHTTVNMFDSMNSEHERIT